MTQNWGIFNNIGIEIFETDENNVESRIIYEMDCIKSGLHCNQAENEVLFSEAFFFNHTMYSAFS